MHESDSDHARANEISPVVATSTVVVHVVGKVASPGVVELPAGSRVLDAVEAVGGVTSSRASLAFAPPFMRIQIADIMPVLQKDAGSALKLLGSEARKEVQITGVVDAQGNFWKSKTKSTITFIARGASEVAMRPADTFIDFDKFPDASMTSMDIASVRLITADAQSHNNSMYEALEMRNNVKRGALTSGDRTDFNEAMQFINKDSHVATAAQVNSAQVNARQRSAYNIEVSMRDAGGKAQIAVRPNMERADLSKADAGRLALTQRDGFKINPTGENRRHAPAVRETQNIPFGREISRNVLAGRQVNRYDLATQNDRPQRSVHDQYDPQLRTFDVQRTHAAKPKQFVSNDPRGYKAHYSLYRSKEDYRTNKRLQRADFYEKTSAAHPLQGAKVTNFVNMRPRTEQPTVRLNRIATLPGLERPSMNIFTEHKPSYGQVQTRENARERGAQPRRDVVYQDLHQKYDGTDVATNAEGRMDRTYMEGPKTQTMEIAGDLLKSKRHTQVRTASNVRSHDISAHHFQGNRNTIHVDERQAQTVDMERAQHRREQTVLVHAHQLNAQLPSSAASNPARPLANERMERTTESTQVQTYTTIRQDPEALHVNGTVPRNVTLGNNCVIGQPHDAYGDIAVDAEGKSVLERVHEEVERQQRTAQVAHVNQQIRLSDEHVLLSAGVEAASRESTTQSPPTLPNAEVPPDFVPNGEVARTLPLDTQEPEHDMISYA